jgi:hypothetical protein
MKNHTTPQFYKNPIPLDSESHGDMTVSPSPNGYAFAATAQTVLVTASEFFDASRQYPIIFSATSDNRIVPLALMGLEPGENLFVGKDGTWLGRYIPAYIRRYPFITTDGSNGDMLVCFEETFDGFNLEGGSALFENGTPSATTREIQAFLQNFHAQFQQTEQFGAMLAQAGLLRQIDAQAALADGRVFNLNGMLVVDEQKLTMLPDIDIVKLFRSGNLALIHAHLLSLRNLHGLLERKE